jgi:hypothetical protein
VTAIRHTHLPHPRALGRNRSYTESQLIIPWTLRVVARLKVTPERLVPRSVHLPMERALMIDSRAGCIKTGVMQDYERLHHREVGLGGAGEWYVIL